MNSTAWLEMQEGILAVFGPVVFWWLIVLLAATVITAIGVVLYAAITRFAN